MRCGNPAQVALRNFALEVTVMRRSIFMPRMLDNLGRALTSSPAVIVALWARVQRDGRSPLPLSAVLLGVIVSLAALSTDAVLAGEVPLTRLANQQHV